MVLHISQRRVEIGLVMEGMMVNVSGIHALFFYFLFCSLSTAQQVKAR